MRRGQQTDFRAILRDRRGVASAEYAILGVGVAIIVGASVVMLAAPVNGAFIRVGGVVTDTIAGLISSGAGTGGGAR